MDNEQLKEVLFPHDFIRKTQDRMVSNIFSALKNKDNMVIHAPTGIGKTVSALAPALSVALKNSLTVFFLTSRQTQHAIAIETLRKIKQKHDVDFQVVDLIAKRGMCLQDVEGIGAGDFIDYCRKLREKKECEYFVRARKPSLQPTIEAEQALSELKILGPMHVSQLIEHCKKPKVCPYEMSTLLAREAKVIIADYNMIFHPDIRVSLFGRASKTLKECIIVVDEGHNLPARCRELLTSKLSLFMLERALKEAIRFEYLPLASKMKTIKLALEHLGRDLNFNQEEKLIRKNDFIEAIEEYDIIMEGCLKAADDIRGRQKQSYVGGIGEFLHAWMGPDVGFARIVSKDEQGNIVLNYRCLDPSLLTREIIEGAYATIIMSGTLQPTYMYKDVLGFANAIEEEFENPFPSENRLCLIVPETTTKFTRRSDEEFKHIAASCNAIIESVPGNVALFFPSYQILNQVYRYLYHSCKKKMFLEKQQLTKQERETLINSFKLEKEKGGVLLAVSSGSFGEGIDLPGDLLKGVVVVGLPLEKPDLETKELIDYYDDRYGKGLDYGYIFPAFMKCLQNAGRCIRSETDKGVIVFLDERFAWQNYLRCFPKDMEVKISKMYDKRIKEFFGRTN